MRCGEQSHVYSWVASSTPDGLPPEGLGCLCGNESYHREQVAVLMLGRSTTGICRVCGVPLDDHWEAEACVAV